MRSYRFVAALMGGPVRPHLSARTPKVRFTTNRGLRRLSGWDLVVVRVMCPLVAGHDGRGQRLTGGSHGDPCCQAGGSTGYRRSAALVRDPILAVKVTAPDVPDWALQRPRITKLIAHGTRRCPLTVVTGPVGAGKTMALAVWSAAESGPVAWISVDEYDSRPGAFWSYLVAALRRSGVAMPKALPATVRGRTAEHLFLLRLASVLAVQNPPLTLVVDDVHLLTEPSVLNGLDFLLRNARGRPAPGDLLANRSAVPATSLPAGGRADRDSGG